MTGRRAAYFFVLPVLIAGGVLWGVWQVAVWIYRPILRGDFG